MWFPLLFLAIFIGCKNSEVKPKITSGKSKIEKPKSHEIFGYRFEIEGDFDGDGKSEKLTEHYWDTDTNKETFKFRDDLEYGDLIQWTDKRNTDAFVLSSNPEIDSLKIGNSLCFGLHLLKNDGDLNGDGNDEISLVIDHADFSSCNSWRIYTYQNGKWKELFKFDILEWQLPQLPDATGEYGLFGTSGKVSIPKQDKANIELENQLKAWPGLVRKIGKNQIQAIFRNEQADEDTMTVNLITMKIKRRKPEFE
ncbi:hypothetical protein [Flavobacterium sp.]|uniref:hypothetical protein n=1 Tax=Flavobacterium sp. TaxID=239 RepID=UPI0011F9823A|nr:hypothetical protein [Flavobacterium sp.]RZJ69478.1 MAG: hypothetical protein EOO49_17365 [Flavobacterium sp.]